MKLKDGFILRQVADTYIVVALSEEAKLCNVMITMNETGAFLWKKLSAGIIDKDAIKKSLSDEYEVDEATAESDVSAFIQKLRENDLLEEN